MIYGPCGYLLLERSHFCSALFVKFVSVNSKRVVFFLPHKVLKLEPEIDTNHFY